MIQGLETTATFDKSKDEFEINSPTITSTKFWPGDLGLNSTHAFVSARLKIGKKDYGVNVFIVQLRDSETHKPLPGVECGDLGPKFGYNSKDNGYLILNKVRIPRRNMVKISLQFNM